MVPTLQVGDRLLIEKVSHKIKGFSRGDIVVFKAPSRSGLKEDLIKRVIGLPGDTILIKSGLVYVNNSALQEPYIAEKPLQDFGPFTVEKNSLFVMGDNRNNSFDSRYWGTVPYNLVIGKAWVRYYPLNRIGLLTDKKTNS